MSEQMKMKSSDEWIKKCDHISINGKNYWFRCTWSNEKKAPNNTSPSMQLLFVIYKEGEGWLNWDDFKGSYLAEKLTDYIKNSINGQRVIYWEANKEKNFS